MIKIKFFPFLFLKRSVYTAIKSINESPSPYSIPSTTTSSGRMQAWIIYYYGDNQQFTLSNSVQMPIILSPKDVLIKVLASSINPIDIRRRGKNNHSKKNFFFIENIFIIEGYGGKLINTYQSMKNILQLGGNQLDKLEFPLILGRDFCGEIIRKGPKVTKFNIGDKVGKF
jgi:threonine dehydrogenase-like Zn-dependent dehydrogenase